MSLVLDQPRERGKFAPKDGLPATMTLPALGGPPPGKRHTATGGGRSFTVVSVSNPRAEHGLYVHTRGCKSGGVPLGEVSSYADIRQALAVVREVLLDDDAAARDACHMCVHVRLR